MTTCQTWSAATSHIRHPWFDTTIMKRKHREIVSPDEEQDLAAAAALRAPLPKRRRMSNLERGFAQMSLGFSDLADIPVVPVDPPPSTITVTPMDADMLPASSSTYSSTSTPVHQLPYTVEEPVVPEVKMKTSSWYEPERDRMSSLRSRRSAADVPRTGIVITDLDSFTEEDEEEDGDVSINSALLDAIRSNTIDNSTKTPTPAPSTSQALVLFRPLPIPDLRKEEEGGRTEEVEVVDTREEERPVDEDVAMDIED